MGQTYIVKYEDNFGHEYEAKVTAEGHRDAFLKFDKGFVHGVSYKYIISIKPETLIPPPFKLHEGSNDTPNGAILVPTSQINDIINN